MTRRSILTMALILLAACARPHPLQGNWIVDMEATIRSAEAISGIPEFLMGRKLRSRYEGGFIRIDDDRLTLGVEGFQEVVAHNYTVVAEEGNCTRLRIAPENREHRYCVEGDRLTVNEPGSRIPIIFKRKRERP